MMDSGLALVKDMVERARDLITLLGEEEFLSRVSEARKLIGDISEARACSTFDAMMELASDPSCNPVTASILGLASGPDVNWSDAVEEFDTVGLPT